ncbi:MAG: glycosyltransferase family 2 protein [Candidatus Hydrogenedentes bacterium]|nr:glycosyltransferase family 2 protein [Candidatus Hydrogenedentota bacterium]
MTPYISILIPVYNEEESLRPLHEEITAALRPFAQRGYEVILVDDGSADASFDVCKSLHEGDPEHVRVIRFRRNFGQTAALAAGFGAARGEVVVPMDADLQNDPADIPRLLEKIDEGYDVVSGWRKDRQDKLVSRRLPSVLANNLISWSTGVHLHDYGCTLKAYRRELTEHLHLYGEMHRFLPALASWAGAKVAEMPVNHRARKFGVSKYGISRTVRVILDLMTVKFLLSYATKPMQVFGKWGVYAGAGGLLSGLLAAALKVLPPHQDITGNPWMYLCILLLLSGLQLIGIGLLGEINVRTYYESQNKPIYTIRETLGGPARGSSDNP